VYGNSPDFLAAIDACVGATALVAISSETDPRAHLNRKLRF